MGLSFIPLRAPLSALLCLVGGFLAAAFAQAQAAPRGAAAPAQLSFEATLVDNARTTTPIKHLAVIDGENVSFDHYFAPYPKAENIQGEPTFAPAGIAPVVNNLPAAELLTHNPNVTNAANGAKAAGGLTLINDVCSGTSDQAIMSGRGIGNLLNDTGIAWGGSVGGFNLGAADDDMPRHNWFQYFSATANPTHARPAALPNIGYSFAHGGEADPANHEYDLTYFTSAVAAGDYPAVSHINLPAYRSGQAGLVTLIHFIQSQHD